MVGLVSGLSRGCAPLRRAPAPATPREILAALYSTPGATELQARGQIRVTSPDGGYTGSVLLYYRYPDSARFVIQAGFGATLAELALTGLTGLAYLPQQKQAFELTPGSAIVVGQAALYPSLVMRLLGPAESEPFADSLSLAVEGRSYVLRDSTPSGRRVWRVDGWSRQLQAEDFRSADNNVEWHREFKRSRNVRVPRMVFVRLGETKTVIDLTYVDAAPRWKGNEFRVRLPADVEVLGREEP